MSEISKTNCITKERIKKGVWNKRAVMVNISKNYCNITFGTVSQDLVEIGNMRFGNSEEVCHPRCFYIQDTVIYCPQFHSRNSKKVMVK